MIVREVKEIARQWIETQMDSLPEFRGAILAGSINWMPDDAPWPPASDVDVWGVMDVDETFDLDPYHQRFSHHGLIVDFAARSGSLFQDWEQVAGTYWLACHVAALGIIADKDGRMQALHEKVAEHYSQREWVRHRCDNAAALHDQELAYILLPEPVIERGRLLHYVAVTYAQLLLVANLGNPTFRKAFVQARELLAEQNRPDVHESLLRIIGSCEIDDEQAGALYRNLEEAFGCSSRVARTRFNHDHFAREMARTPVVDGTRELIEAGYPREAVGWMLLVRPLCQTAIDFDASEQEIAYFQESYTSFLHTLGLYTLADYEARAELARSLRPTVMQVAEAIMDSNVRIVG